MALAIMAATPRYTWGMLNGHLNLVLDWLTATPESMRESMYEAVDERRRKWVVGTFTKYERPASEDGGGKGVVEGLGQLKGLLAAGGNETVGSTAAQVETS